MTETAAPEVRLGNDIARQFAHLPDGDAVARIADHLLRFWDPRMRARLRDLVAAGDPDLDARVVVAAELL
ncbi:MAG: formate dehydrogenase subunit delta [Nocardioides sp.]